VVIWNTRDPWGTLVELVKYTLACKRSPTAGGGGDLWFGVAFSLLALCVFVATVAMGIITPSLVHIGHVAPVRPSAVFWPNTGSNYYDDKFAIRGQAILRALGSVEAARVTLRSNVQIERRKVNSSDETYMRSDTDKLDYVYRVSGVDMGIQGGSDLELEVTGVCDIMEEWYLRGGRPEEEYRWADNPERCDWYDLWTGTDLNQTWYVLADNATAKYGARAEFVLGGVSSRWRNTSSASYAVLINSAFLESLTPSGDSWYETRVEDYRYQVKRGRPPLACLERNQWSYRGQNVSSVFDLKGLIGMQILRVLLEIVEAAFLDGPMILSIEKSSGSSALKSQTTGGGSGKINAKQCSMFDDMERFVLASFVATRNILSDAAMSSGSENMVNLVTGSDRRPKPGTGQFVLSVPNVQTFSLTGIVSLASILGFLALANLFIWLLIHFHQGRGKTQQP
jgi:hypothetical protein